MSSTSVLLFIIGIFLVVNAPNIVGIFKGDTKFSFVGGAKPAETGTTPVVNSQTGFVTGGKAIASTPAETK